MKGFLYCISRLFEKTGEAAREYMLVHGSAGRINRGGRILVKKNASVEIREGGELVTGKGTVTFQSGCRLVVEKDGHLIIGDDVGINSNCYIAVHNRVSIGSNTIFGPGVTVVDQDHDYKAEGGLKAEKYKVGSVDIGNNVWIGAGAVILRDTVIEDNAVIGAGSVVRGRVPGGSVFVNGR